jgi:adenosine deaminase
MLDAGLTVTINSDDPAYFGGYMNENFASVGSALGLSSEELIALARRRTRKPGWACARA